MRKKLSSLLILLLFALSLFSGLNVNTMVSAVEPSLIYVDPVSTEDPNLTIGMLYTVSIKTDYDGSDVWGWQFTLTYNPSVLEGFEVTNGDLITTDKSPWATFIPGTFDNEEGNLSSTAAFFFFIFPPPYLTSGPGTLANVTFRVIGIGPTDITLGLDTLLLGRTEPPQYTLYEIAIQLQDGDFDNTGAQSNPPWLPDAVIITDEDAYANEPATFSGEGSSDPDGTLIISYRWDFGDETPPVSTTDPIVLHTYTTAGIYTVSLRVTDQQNQVSEPAFQSVTMKERPPYIADLVKWKAKPEARTWDYSKDEDKNVTITALARNKGSKSVGVSVTFAIIDAASGMPAGDDIVASCTLGYGPELDVPIPVEFDPLDYDYEGTKKVLYVHVTLRYDGDADGTYETATNPKIFRFSIVP